MHGGIGFVITGRGSSVFGVFEEKADGGVCGGIAEYSEIDLTLVRVLMALFIIFGVGLMVYIVMWIIIPLEPAKQENYNEYRR